MDETTMEFRPMRRFRQQLPQEECVRILDEPVREPGDWWYHVKSVICFGRMRIVEGDIEHMTGKQVREK